MKKQEDFKSTNLDDLFERFIMRFHKNVINSLRREAYKLSFSVPQIEVLHCVIEKKNPTMKEIAQFIMVKPPSITPIVESLFEKGFLMKISDKADRRAVRVSSTAKARKTFSKMKKLRREAIQKTLSELPEKEKEEFKKILKILNK